MSGYFFSSSSLFYGHRTDRAREGGGGGGAYSGEARLCPDSLKTGPALWDAVCARGISVLVLVMVLASYIHLVIISGQAHLDFASSQASQYLILIHDDHWTCVSPGFTIKQESTTRKLEAICATVMPLDMMLLVEASVFPYKYYTAGPWYMLLTSRREPLRSKGG